jgi:biopolymer transport protein ExbD
MAGGASQDADDAIVGINVTPLVDVTLVLCIILMVTAKMVTQPTAIPLELPRAASGSTDVQTMMSIELAANGATVVDSKLVANEDAIFELAKTAHTKNPDIRTVIRADQTVQHGRVIHVLDLLKQAGVAKIAFATALAPPVQSAGHP